MPERQQGNADYDYIVVGAGSAGCALAAGLSEDPTSRVLVLEAGPKQDSMWFGIPAGMTRVIPDPRYNWLTPSNILGRSGFPTQHGKVLGGGSAINGMVYMRGYPGNYDSWAQYGIRGWSWEDVLPAFRAMERHEDGESEMHGGAGSLAVSHLPYCHPTTDAFVAASANLGLRATRDLNDGSEVDSAGPIQVTIGNGRRCSSYDAFLAPAMGRRNLTVQTGVLARRITFEGRRATGVEYECDGQIRHASARRVVVSSGAVNSPQLLLLSGIGPARELAALGIEVVHDLPGVGRNFQDHAYASCSAEVVRGASMNRMLEGLPVAMAALRYLFTRKGPLSAGGSQGAAMLRSSPDLAVPDLEMSFRPFTVQLAGQKKVVIDPGEGITIMPAVVMPASRGAITLNSPDPLARPTVDYNMLEDPRDQHAMIKAMRWTLACFQTEPLKSLMTGKCNPGFDSSDEALLDHARAIGFPGAHCAGSCAMGSGPLAVVDDQLSVHGVEGLSVCDASIMPEVVAGNTNGPSIMIGYRGSQMIRRQAAV